MLPDMRAVFAAFVAAIGLLMIAFAAVAAFRVAQESRSGSFQADLARRGQIVPPQSGPRFAVIETPGPHIAPPPPLPVVEIKTAPVGAEVSAIPVVREAPPDPPPIAVAAPREQETPREPETVTVTVTEPPVGGPLAEPAPASSDADRAAARAQRAKKLAAARKAREARIARQRKVAAARRAAARAKQQAATSSFNNGFGSQSFGNSGFGSTFGKQ